MKYPLLIADAGGTSTEWFLFHDAISAPISAGTAGINAAVSSDLQIQKSFEDAVVKLNLCRQAISDNLRVIFFGAGVNSETTKKRLDNLAKITLPAKEVEIEFHSDLEGAAIALFGKDKGIACILGTGSASCLYEDGKIIDRIPSLGFILGDEGSGAQMGKLLLNKFFKRELPLEIKVKLEAYADMDLSNVIEKIYRQPNPNHYLASFVPFIKENEECEEINTIIIESLKLFFNINVLKYKTAPETSIRFVGGVANAFRRQIEFMATSLGFKADKFLPRPIEAIGSYYMTIDQ